MSTDPISISTLIAIGGGIVAYAIREAKKTKTEKSNNGDIKEIKKSTGEILTFLNKVDKNLGIVSTDVENMRKNCKATTERFEKDIDESREDIKSLLKRKGSNT